MKKNIILIILVIILLTFFTGCFEKETKQNNQIENNSETEKNNQTENDTENNTIQLNVTTKPYLWKIEGDTPSYLFGTVHLREEEILTLPDIVFESVLSSAKVFTEVKLDLFSIYNASIGSLLPNGQTLEDVLPDEIFEKLNSYISSKNLPQNLEDNIKRLKIWSAAGQVSILSDSDTENGNQPSLDSYIWNIASENNIETGGIETVEEQLNLLDSFTLEEKIEYLNETLDYVEEMEDEGKHYVDFFQDEYLKGELDSMLDLLYADFDQNDSLDQKMKQVALVNRNINMTERIVDNLTKNPDKQFFFAAGVGHYVGNNSIISLLENKGYTVSRVSFEECTSCDKNEIKIDSRCYMPYLEKYAYNFT